MSIGVFYLSLESFRVQREGDNRSGVLGLVTSGHQRETITVRLVPHGRDVLRGSLDFPCSGTHLSVPTIVLPPPRHRRWHDLLPVISIDTSQGPGTPSDPSHTVSTPSGPDFLDWDLLPYPVFPPTTTTESLTCSSTSVKNRMVRSYPV